MPSTPATRHGNGPGYGPPKGPGSGPAKPFNDPRPPALADNHDPEEQAYRQAQRAKKRELRQRMLAVLERNAEDEKNPGAVQVQAADKLLDRIDGKPVAHVDLKADVRRSVQDLTDEELAALAGEGESEN